MPMVFDYELCDGCGDCAAVCPGDVIYLQHDGARRRPYNRYVQECWHCGSCRQDCPQKAIKVMFPPDMLCI